MTLTAADDYRDPNKTSVFALYYNGALMLIGLTKTMNQKKNEYRYHICNEKARDYDLPLFKFMRETGPEKFDIVEIEKVDKANACDARRMWNHTFEELGLFVDWRNQRIVD
jgi:hypothetical protein